MIFLKFFILFQSTSRIIIDKHLYLPHGDSVMPAKPIEPYSPQKLLSLIQRLDRLSGRLRAVATWMEQEEQEMLLITNHKSMVKGLEFAEAFGHAAERAVDNFRLTGQSAPDETPENN